MADAETTVNVLGGGDTSVPESVRVALETAISSQGSRTDVPSDRLG